MNTIPDFTEVEHRRIFVVLFERYVKLVPVQFSDTFQSRLRNLGHSGKE
jgi:hypothetical protein